MKQLGSLDSAFINLEQHGTPQHIGGFGIYDPSTAPGGKVRFKDVIANYEARLKDMPIFRTRLVQVPLGLDKPYWVIDENFDVEFHLRHIALPKPGDWRQLCILIARLHARPLDLNRPLWECYIIEGLDKIANLPRGAFAVYTKMHHAMVDGSGSDSFMSALHDLEPAPKPSKKKASGGPLQTNVADKHLSNSAMLRNALFNNIKSSLKMPVSTVKTIGSIAKFARDIASDKLPAMPSGTPKTRFDDPVGPHRVFEAALFDLDELKRIRKATDATINDIAICIVSGAIRTYLQHHNELPQDSIACMMPMDVSDRGDSSENNQIGATVCIIHTDIEDPMERLKAISSSTTDAKKFVDTPMSEMARIPGVFNPWLSKNIAKLYVSKQLTRHLPLGSCGAITNVIGPNIDLYTAGARLVNYYCAGLLTAGVGMFHAIFSMNGTVSFSVLADRDIMPDPEFYRECLENSFKEVVEASPSGSNKPAKIAKLKTKPSPKKTASRRTRKQS